MIHNIASQSIRRLRTLPAVLLLMACTTLWFPTTALAIGPYIRIEQDWEMVLNTPDGTANTPQVVLQMDPFPGSTVGCLLLINYQDTPNYSEGGLQMQIWDGELNLANLSEQAGVNLATSGEKITYTTFMELSGGTLIYGISKGTSKTWGPIPKNGLSVSIPYNTITDFSSYATSDTLSESGILFGENAVKSLTLKAVRKYDKAGKNDPEPSKTLYP